MIAVAILMIINFGRRQKQPFFKRAKSTLYALRQLVFFQIFFLG